MPDQKNGTTTTQPDDRCYACAASATLHAATGTKREHLATVFLMGVIQGSAYFTLRRPLPMCPRHRRELVELTRALEDTLPPEARSRVKGDALSQSLDAKWKPKVVGGDGQPLAKALESRFTMRNGERVLVIRPDPEHAQMAIDLATACAKDGGETEDQKLAFARIPEDVEKAGGVYTYVGYLGMIGDDVRLLSEDGASLGEVIPGDSFVSPDSIQKLGRNVSRES